MPENVKEDKIKDFKGTMKKLIGYVKRHRLGFFLASLFALFSTIFSIIGPNILGNVTTEIFNGLISKITGSGSMNFDFIKKTLLALLILYLFSSVCSLLQNYIMNSISCKISYNLRKDISEKIHKLPLAYFETKKHGDILSRITNDVDIFSENLSQCLSETITSVATLIGTFVMMIKISGSMTIASAVILPISVILMGLIMKKSQKFFTRQQKNIGDMNGLVEEIYGGQDIVKVFNNEEETIENFSKINKKLYDSGWKSQFISTTMHPVMMFVGNINYVLVSIYGGYLVITNKIKVGDILSFSQYVKNLNNSASNLAQIFAMLQPTVAAAERVFEFLEEPEEKEDVKNPVSIKNIKTNIEFKDVNFGYTEDKTIIHNFSLKVKEGQKIAIVGPTGAGKTTLVKLLMRFYEVNSGEILIDGHNIKKFKRNDLRSLFGMVLQDTWLYSGTIEDNVKYGKLDANIEEVKDVCRAASVHHFVKTLPDTYNMLLNEDSDNISSGQKQLLTIARVILANPKILILDEATSSVDTRTEILIQQAMDKLMEGRTSFVIAHRLSTIKNADLILVMDKGDIVEIGNHKELLEKNGFYAKLYNSQFEK